MAVMKAIEWVYESNINEDLVIITDSLDTVTALTTGISRQRPTLLDQLEDTLWKLNSRRPTSIEIIWVPAHNGIPGNNAADALAKEALGRTVIDISTAMEYQEVKEHTSKFFYQLWQQQWDADEKGRKYYNIKPTVGRSTQYFDKNRRKETTISRLRFGACRLNAHLHRLNLTPDGNCNGCQLPETVQHYLLECRVQAELAGKLRTRCATMRKAADLSIILNDQECIDIIYDTIRKNQRWI